MWFARFESGLFSKKKNAIQRSSWLQEKCAKFFEGLEMVFGFHITLECMYCVFIDSDPSYVQQEIDLCNGRPTK